MNVFTKVITGGLPTHTPEVVAQRSNAHAAPAPAVAAAITSPGSHGPHRGQAGVMRGHRLRPVEDRERSHDDLRVLEAVAEPLQDGGEVGSLLRYWVPALTHQSVQRTRAVVGGLQPPTVGDQLHHLLVGPAGVGHVAEGHHLPQQDAEGPDRT